MITLRRKAREAALQMLYRLDDPNLPDGIDFGRLDQELNHFEIQNKVLDFTRDLVRGTFLHREEIDQKLEKLSDRWKISRMPTIDRNILRMALYELIYEPKTPPPVVIDEAVEMAKKFAAEQSPQFLNGILDAFVRTPPTS